MRVARLMSTLLLVLAFVPRAFAQVSCANPDNLCTGDPCTTTHLEVQSPCVVDFGARALVIGGALNVPSGGTLSLTATSIVVQGPIEGPGASVTLIATTGGVDLRTEIDVDAGSITVSAAGNIDVKNRLKAKSVGSVALAAGGTLVTRVAAVIEAEGGSVALSGASGVTIAGRVFVEGSLGGTIQVASSAGPVTLDQALRTSDGSVTVNGETGVIVNATIYAVDKAGLGGTVTLTSGAGDVAINGKIWVKGLSGGSITANAPLGTVEAHGLLDAKGRTDGGSVAMTAANITLGKGIKVAGDKGNGGTIQLVAATALTLNLGRLDARGKLNGGVIGLLGDVASGDVTVDGMGIRAFGGSGNGGILIISAPAGAVSLRTKADLVGKGGMGGQVQVDGVAITIGPKSRFDADGRVLGGELRFNQSGAGLFLLDGTFEAGDGGVIEALAPAGDLTARGDFRVGPAGCVGWSAGGTLDAMAANVDVPPTASCP